ncbi:MAG: MFS transporter [Planctomycetota bacterium]
MNLPAIVAFAGAFVVGVNFAIIGSIKLRLAERLDIDDARAGSLISALMFCCMIVVLIVGPLRDWLGYRAVALPGFALAGGCLWLLAKARSYRAAFIACLLLGVGTMAVSTTSNVLASAVLFDGEAPSAALNLVNVFYGIGAFITPLLAAYLLRRLGYTTAVSIFGALVFLPTIIALVSGYPAAEGFQFAQYLDVITGPAAWIAGIALFCYVGLEQTMGGFVTTYLTDSGYDEETAGWLLSGFWISLMVSRIGAGVGLTDLAPVHNTVFVCALALIGTASIIFMILAKSRGSSAVAVLVTGLAFGPIFPTLVGVSLAQYTKALRGSAFSLVFALGLLGGTVLPPVIGSYSDRITIRKSLWIAVAVCAALFVISGGLGALIGLA